MTTSDNTPLNDSQNTHRDDIRLDQSRSHSASKRKSVSARDADRIALPGISPASRNSIGLGFGATADTGSEPLVGSVSDGTPANDNSNDVAILRRDGHDPAIVIGLALRYVRLGRDVPFAIVSKLFRHAEAGDGAARATVEMLRRRVERRQRERWRRYVGNGLRAPSLPGPDRDAARLQGAKVEGSAIGVGSRGRADARRLSLGPDRNDARNKEGGQ